MSFKKARVKAGMSVAEAAAALKISDKAIYYWEAGKYFPEACRFKEIAALYGCTVDELLKEDEANEKE